MPPKKRYNNRQWTKPQQTTAGPPVKRISGAEAQAMVDSGEITHVADIPDKQPYIGHE